MNWPSVLVSFWSNYAWSAGIIYNQHMQNTINKFIGSNRGNISVIGAAQNGVDAVGLGGGYEISQIYKRADEPYLEPYGDIIKRQTASTANSPNGTQQFSWYGKPALPGLPLPGNFSGFAGTLAELNIPASNAFMTGLLWFLILVACVLGAVVLLKLTIEALGTCRMVKTSRLVIFRKHWSWFAGAAVLRACYIAFFMMMFFTMFQFTLGGAHGVEAVAAVVLTVFLVGMLGISVLAVWYRTRSELLPEIPEQASQESQASEKTGNSAWHKIGSNKAFHTQDTRNVMPPRNPWLQKYLLSLHSGRVHPHDDENYTMKFGWLSSRFRRSKWWFFSAWSVYELVRAAFYGGAAGHTLVQVFGLLVWEFIALVAILLTRPFESNRLNLIMVYILGFSKVATVALASAFDSRFGLDRIITTVIGVVIIVIQGILTICLLTAIVLGAISSYMSVTRHHEGIKPRSLLGFRTRYFAHIDHKATDRPKPPPPPPPEPERPKEPYFMVSSVRRKQKIEDDHEVEVDKSPRASASMEPEKQFHHSRSTPMMSRTSMSNLPYGARPHRSSWSTRDFQQMGFDQMDNPMHSRISLESSRDVQNRHRASSLRGPSRLGTPMGEVSGMPNTSDGTAPWRGHRRNASTPLGPKRNSSTVAEENDPNGTYPEPRSDVGRAI